MCLNNCQLDAVQFNLRQLRDRLYILQNRHQNHSLDIDELLETSKAIDEIINVYIDMIKKAEATHKQCSESTNNLTANNVSVFNSCLQDIKGDLEEVCISILFILYMVKENKSIKDMEYKELIQSKKQLLEGNKNLTIKELFELLEE